MSEKTLNRRMTFGSFLEVFLDDHKDRTNNSAVKEKVNPFRNDILSWADYFDSCPDIICHVEPTAFILDYGRSEVAYISSSIENLIGVDRLAFSGRNGILRLIDLINPNDFKIYSEQIFRKQLNYLATVTHTETRDVVFSNTMRIKQSNGHYKTLLMKQCFILDEHTGLPLYEFGTFTDISAIKKELSINHTIERFVKGDTFPLYIRVLSEDYFPEMDVNLLTAREKEILTNLSLGIKRKDVGSKLFISDNTVANHIKTILRKTNTKNIRAAIAKCKMNGII